MFPYEFRFKERTGILSTRVGHYPLGGALENVPSVYLRRHCFYANEEEHLDNLYYDLSLFGEQSVKLKHKK